MKLFLIIVIALFVFIAVSGYGAIRLRQKTNAETTSTISWWGPKQQAGIVVILMAVLFWALFPAEVQRILKIPLAITILLASLTILWITGKSEGVIKIAKALAVIGIIYFLFAYILNPSIKKHIPDVWKMQQTKIIKKDQKIEKQITVLLRSDRWSEPVYLPPRVKFFFEGPSAKFIREKDGFIGSTEKWYGDDTRFQSGLRFKGPDGETLTIKIVPLT